MNRKLTMRSFLSGIAITALSAGMITSAAAGILTTKDIKVHTGAEIYIDGIKLEPTDANGNPVETFIYNGTTYVPLRAVSESLGKSVSWDGENSRVYIGEAPGSKQYLLTVCPPYQKEVTYFFDEPATITMSGKKYANGCAFCGYALFNLDGKYDTLSFDVGHIDGDGMVEGTLNIYLDDSLSFSVDLDPESMPQHYDIPLHNALQMKIELDGWNARYYGNVYGLCNLEVS